MDWALSLESILASLLLEYCSGNVLCLEFTSVKIDDICILQVVELEQSGYGLYFLFLFPSLQMVGLLSSNEEKEAVGMNREETGQPLTCRDPAGKGAPEARGLQDPHGCSLKGKATPAFCFRLWC